MIQIQDTIDDPLYPCVIHDTGPYTLTKHNEAEPEAQESENRRRSSKTPPSNLLMKLMERNNFIPSEVMPISPLTHEPMFKL